MTDHTGTLYINASVPPYHKGMFCCGSLSIKEYVQHVVRRKDAPQYRKAAMLLDLGRCHYYTPNGGESSELFLDQCSLVEATLAAYCPRGLTELHIIKGDDYTVWQMSDTQRKEPKRSTMSEESKQDDLSMALKLPQVVERPDGDYVFALHNIRYHGCPLQLRLKRSTEPGVFDMVAENECKTELHVIGYSRQSEAEFTFMVSHNMQYDPHRDANQLVAEWRLVSYQLKSITHLVRTSRQGIRMDHYRHFLTGDEYIVTKNNDKPAVFGKKSVALDYIATELDL